MTLTAWLKEKLTLICYDSVILLWAILINHFLFLLFGLCMLPSNPVNQWGGDCISYSSHQTQPNKSHAHLLNHLSVSCRGHLYHQVVHRPGLSPPKRSDLDLCLLALHRKTVSRGPASRSAAWSGDSQSFHLNYIYSTAHSIHYLQSVHNRNLLAAQPINKIYR